MQRSSTNWSSSFADPGKLPTRDNDAMTVAVPLSSINWRLVAASILVVTVATQPAFVVAATIEQAGPELGYGAQMLGFMTAAYFLTAAASSRLIGGRVVERIGWRRSMLANAVGAALVLSGIGAFAHSVRDLFAGLIPAAVLYGLANPAANLALARDVPPARQGLIFGFKHGGIPTSSLLAGLAVPTIALTLGWRWVFAASALLALAVVVLIPREPRPYESAVTVAPAYQRGMGTAWLTMLSLGSAFATVAAMALGAFHVDAAIDAGFSEGQAGLILALGSAASITARITYGYWADRKQANGLSWVALAVLVGALAFVLFALVPSGVFIVLTVIAFATGWGWPGLMTFGVVRANAGQPAASTAITQAGIFLGAGLGPAGLGWLIENRSYDAAWLATAASLTIAAGVVTFVVRRGLESIEPT